MSSFLFNTQLCSLINGQVISTAFPHFLPSHFFFLLLDFEAPDLISHKQNMNYSITTRFNENPFLQTTHLSPRRKNPPTPSSLLHPLTFICKSSHQQNPNLTTSSSSSYPLPLNKTQAQPKTLHLLKPIILIPNLEKIKKTKKKKLELKKKKTGFSKVGSLQMLILCGFGYWVQGFRCFPWLGLNFNMANTLNLNPSTLQMLQISANLPMVAKPLYGVLSDAIYIGGAHRIPYISIGAALQVVSWGLLALTPVVSEALPAVMACMLLSNLGASITEVTKDALIAEYGKKHKVRGLQSYAFMALAAGGILGNFFGGYFLLKTQQPKFMYLLFSLLLSVQFAISLKTREDTLGIPGPSAHFSKKSVSKNLHKQFSDLIIAVKKEAISRPLSWIVASIVVVPILSGTMFCYQTQYLKLDSSIIGMSKVVGHLMLLLATVSYDRYWKKVPVRKLIFTVQMVYAASLLLDLILVKQINLKLGIPNDIFVLCLSGLAETVAQFKLLPLSVLFANLCPPGCEGSLMSFLASALCLSSIISGFLGVGLSSLIGISSGDYSKLSVGIIVQFLAALVPLGWISFVPMSELREESKRKKIFRR